MPSFPDPFEVDLSDGSHKALTLLGEAQSYNDDGTINYGPLTLSFLSDTAPLPKLIPAPFLTATQPSRTEIDVTWTPLTPQAGTPPVTSWVLQRRASTDNGVTFGSWAAVTGSPFAATTFTKNDTGLSTGTPEVVFQYQAAGVNDDGQGDWSNIVAKQFGGNPVPPPTAPTGFGNTDVFSNHLPLAWSETADATVTKHGLFQGVTTPVLVKDNLDATATAYDWTGLTPGSTISNLSVARYNGSWSPVSNRITVTLPLEDPLDFTILTGVSDSDNDHGGTESWQGWRDYTRSAMLARANATGSLRPTFLAYSANGTALGYGQGDPVGASDYTSIYNYVRSELDNFYYGGTGQTHSARWGIRLYWSVGGNENSDKAPLSATTTHTATQINNYVTVMRASYDAAHFIDPVTSQRRYPDAYVGSNPTQEHERLGYVADWLAASARYHDFVMWSMYPPGRGVNDTSLSRNPRWDFPSFVESDRTKRQPGFLIRCFYRTKQAEAQARLDTGNPNFRLIIGCGEVGMASDPDDRATRPYYAVHALIGSMWKLARQYALRMDFACWWDNQTSATAPHNIMTDEQPNCDHLAQANGGVTTSKGDNSIATNPTLRQAWVNWMQYDKRQPGSTQPAQWAGKPNDIDNYTGTLI